MKAKKKVYTAEVWTVVCGPKGEHELWATIMPDGQPCAFGGKTFCTEYAQRLNAGNVTVIDTSKSFDVGTRKFHRKS
jgi:hypothetical protein